MTRSQNTDAAVGSAEVDVLNASFYDAIQYPGPVYSLHEITPSDLWSRMLSQDLGDWTGGTLPSRPKIWIAGCGRNQALITAMKFPDAEVVGSDLAAESLATCRKHADALGVKNLELRKESLNEVKYAGVFDYVLCTGVIHHNADPSIPLANLSRAVKRDGVLEVMVYNEYHRLHTAAFQQATRRLLGNLSAPDLAKELAVAKKLAACFTAPGRMNEFLAEYRDPDCKDAYFCDSLLQPMECSYNVESLAELSARCNLELLHFRVDQFSMTNGAISWNLELPDPELQAIYFGLDDVTRWQIANLMLQETSPMLWFYLQRQDSSRPRKPERQLANEFLETRFARTKATLVAYGLQPDGSYKRASRSLPFPGKPRSEAAAHLYEALDEAMPIGDTVRRLGLDTSFSNVHALRVQLATSAYPFLQSAVRA